MRVLLVFLAITGCVCYAQPNIGLTTLYFSTDAGFQNNPVAHTPMESGVLPEMAKFNQMVTADVQLQLTNFPKRLQQKLIESGTYNIFDATPLIKAWSINNSTLVSSWENESANKETENTAADKIKGAKESAAIVSPVTPHQPADDKYILIGWVTSIKANEVRQVFTGTDKTSLLYNLNIDISYKIIDADTRHVITQFVASGHGGFAKIIPNRHKLVTNDAGLVADMVAADTVDSLLISVKHGLMIKQDLGLLPK